ncbi:MAG: DNA gyrase inhibitor YacG [Candidatus Binatia bacterium]
MRVRCPICRREVAWEGNAWRPFCSERCKLVDLGNWVTERYRVPDAPAPAEGAEDDGEGEDT